MSVFTVPLAFISTAHAVADSAAQAAVPPGLAHDSLLSLVTSSGPVVQAVLYMLVLSSIGCWGVVLFKYRQIRTARKESAEFIRIFWETKNLTTIYDVVDQLPRSSVALVFRAGYRELVRLTRDRQEEGSSGAPVASAVSTVERAMKRSVNQQVTDLERHLTFLATTASAAPFIGLFGTVWGIMNAFRGLSVTHSSSIQAVAPGIAEALIATATGLAAAIPAVIAYNHFAREIRVLSADMQNFSSEFLNIAERHFLR